MYRCERCGKKVTADRYVINPFDQDIWDEENWQYLCEDCEQTYREDI